jgi:trimeric autotransporter adhesin
MRIGRVAVSAALATAAFSAYPAAEADVSDTSTIHAVAGTCLTPGYSGDRGQATSALVDRPRDSEFGPDGSLYFVDTYNNRVRRIAPDGRITTVAGSGFQGYNGDGKAATKVGLHWPHDVFVDDAGNLFIADSNNNRVREVTTDGVIHTVAGTGVGGFSGDGGPATSAKLKQPKSVYVFGGYLYIADLANVVRRVDLTTGIIETYAGRPLTGGFADGYRVGQAMFNGPQRIQIDSHGNVYVADTLNHRIRRIDAGTGQVTTVAGTGVKGYNGASGAATSMQLNQPRGLALEGDTRLFVADSNNQRIRRVDLLTGQLTTVAGRGKGCAGVPGPASGAMLYQPRGLSVSPSGDLIVCDTLNSRILQIDHL